MGGRGCRTLGSARDSKTEPMLTFKLSDEHVFRCSECDQEIASFGAGRYNVVIGVIDLIATFVEHVRRYHPN